MSLIVADLSVLFMYMQHNPLKVKRAIGKVERERKKIETETENEPPPPLLARKAGELCLCLLTKEMKTSSTTGKRRAGRRQQIWKGR